jgi:hypothetical protein
MTHAALGRLTYRDNGIWDGSVPTDGIVLDIAIAGDHGGPFAAQVERLLRTIADFAGLRQTVSDCLQRILKSVPDVGPESFRIRGLWFLWPKKPDYFMVQLALEGDEFGLWKLEFEGPRATYLSRDD